MTPDKIIVIISGIIAIVFTYWFFLMKKNNKVEVEKEVTIKVEGGYTPEEIIIPKNKPVTINFIRTDPSTCLEDVVLSDFKIRKNLPLNEKVSIILTPDKEGTFTFSCGMGMYHGKITVK